MQNINLYVFIQIDIGMTGEGFLMLKFLCKKL